MSKLLYIENVASIHAVNFYLAASEAAKRCDMEFHNAYAAADRTKEAIADLKEKYGVIFHQVDFIRTPYDLRNIRAYRQICHLIREEQIDVIHCNTPIGGLIGRLAGRRCKVRHVIYQAHGFHFYKGAPLLSWLLYYPIEKCLARLTDTVITINREDAAFAEKHFHPRRGFAYVPGVGIKIGQFAQVETDSAEKRRQFGLLPSDFVILFAGRLEKNKNCSVLLQALQAMPEKNAKLIICGEGEERAGLEQLTEEMKLQERVHFLGNREDIAELYHMSDCFALASYREGLPRSVMEAMACGLPCVVSDIRGNTDLVDAQGGFLCPAENAVSFSAAFSRLCGDVRLREAMSRHNREKIQQFSYQKVVGQLQKIYQEI